MKKHLFLQQKGPQVLESLANNAAISSICYCQNRSSLYFADLQYMTYVEFNTTNANVHQTIWGNSEVIYPEYKYHQYVKVNKKE